MQCPECGYMMGALDKVCLRCAATQDRSAKNPYVAFQNERMTAADLSFSVTPPFEAPDAQAPDAQEVGGDNLTAPCSVSRPQIFLKALMAALLVIVFYHWFVVWDMQRQIDGLDKTTQDQQKQISDLRNIVNYNANAANSSRF